MNKMTWISALAATAVLGLSAGCHNKPAAQEIRRDAFVPDDQPRALRSVILAQEAVGARKDATLHPADFDSEGLNSLGQEKLDLMLAVEEPASPLEIYLDLPAGSTVAPAHTAVAEYLKNRGLPEAQVSVKDGPNPHASNSAADSVNSLRSLSTAAAAAQSSATPAAGSASAAGK